MKYLINFVLVCLSLQSLMAASDNKSNMLGLRTTVYMVNDIEKAKNWYTQAFGIKQYFDQPYYVGFNIRGF
jgi:lactoylglutathione lyase